ncbi:hypothetical protein DFH27DRAFT_613914 [Peziza echinospora]|nr:hypothetical protein DFH27DRAFT_613914 [Peziza echinospora]
MVNLLTFLLPPIIISLPQTLSHIDFHKLSLSQLPEYILAYFPTAHIPSIHTDGIIPPDGNPLLNANGDGGPESHFVPVEELYERYISGVEGLWNRSGDAGGEVRFVWFTREKEVEGSSQLLEETEKKEGEEKDEVLAVVQEVEEVIGADGKKEDVVVQEVKQVCHDGRVVEVPLGDEDEEEEKWDGDRVFNDSAIAISQTHEAANPVKLAPVPVVAQPIVVEVIYNAETGEEIVLDTASEQAAPELPEVALTPTFIYINCSLQISRKTCSRFWILPEESPSLFVITPDSTIYPIPQSSNFTAANYTTLWEEKGWEAYTPWTGAFNPLTGSIGTALEGSLGEYIGQTVWAWNRFSGRIWTLVTMLTLRWVTMWVLNPKAEKKDEKKKEQKGKDVKTPKVIVQNGESETTVLEAASDSSSSL